MDCKAILNKVNFRFAVQRYWNVYGFIVDDYSLGIPNFLFQNWWKQNLNIKSTKKIDTFHKFIFLRLLGHWLMQKTFSNCALSLLIKHSKRIFHICMFICTTWCTKPFVFMIPYFKACVSMEDELNKTFVYHLNAVIL